MDYREEEDFMSDEKRAASGAPTATGAAVTLDRAAVVVIDLQNDFCAPEGVIRRHGYAEDPEAIERAVERTIELCDALRRAGGPCIFVRSFMDDKYKLPNLLRRHKALGLTRQVCKENSWGAGFYRIQLEEPDRIVTKHTNDAFLYTFLEPLLRKLEATTIVLAGVYTELCVEDTARSAIARGFHVVLAQDCTAGLSRVCARASLDTLRAFQVEVLESSALISPEARASISWIHEDTRKAAPDDAATRVLPREVS
jgi:ureidoacrylate peracid hydrolase